MSYKLIIDRNITNYANLQSLVEVYQEISAIRMRKVKKSVLESRDYLKDLNILYSATYNSYMTFVTRAKIKDELTQDKITTPLYVLLSSNTGLYGDVIRNVFQIFTGEFEKMNGKDVDLLIVGKFGKNWFDRAFPDRKYVYCDLPDAGYQDVNLKPIADIIRNYLNIIIFHGVFESVLSQVPKKSYISVGITETKNTEQPNFIYEPSVAEILKYFEEQIKALLFEQTIFESSLSKYASRMVNLESSSTKIKNYISQLNLNKRKFLAARANTKQLQVLSTNLYMES